MNGTAYNIPCLYFSASEKGILIEVNELLCTNLGYTTEELVGKRQEMLFTLATRIFQQTHFYPLVQMQGHAEEIYITLLAKNGEHIPVLVNARRKETKGQMIFQYAGIVIKERKKFEDEIIDAKKIAEKALHENTALQVAKAELQHQAEELDRQILLANRQHEELRQFNRLVTHDLQEPLRKLGLFTDIMLAAEDLDKAKVAVQKIRKIAEQMRDTLMGLQRYMWLTESSMANEETALEALLQEVLADVKKENPDVTILLQSDALPNITANSEQMRFLLYELLSNAVRFRSKKNEASVMVSVSTLLLNKFRQVINKYQYIEFLKLQVADNGIGMDNRFTNQAFELFRRLHFQSGRGIGLTLVKKIVENHGGSIALDSLPGGGIMVTIHLPLREARNNSHEKV